MNCGTRERPLYAESWGPAVRGLTFLEITVAVLLVAIITASVVIFRRNSERAARRTNAVLVASQLIERQIEKIRSQIAGDRAAHWPPSGGFLTDSASGVTLEWTVEEVHDPRGMPVAAVRNVKFVARWWNPRADSVVVSSYLSRDF